MSHPKSAHLHILHIHIYIYISDMHVNISVLSVVFTISFSFHSFPPILGCPNCHCVTWQIRCRYKVYKNMVVYGAILGGSSLLVPSGKLTWQWNINISIGHTSSKGPFSIAMLVYQSVVGITQFINHKKA